jgi:AcrR family transcriptional regulator
MCPASAARPTTAVPSATRSSDSVPQRLVQAAAQLFAEKGFENTSVQEIVDAVGMTKGAMYHYFTSKDDLLYEIYARLLRMQTAHLESIAQSDGPVEDRLHALVVDLVRTTLANIQDVTIFVRSLHLLSDERRAEIHAARRNYATRFRDLIEEGQRLGTLRSDGMPVDLRAYHFFGALHWMHMWYRPDGRYSADEIARYFADDLLDSLLR